jgi:hypothetical protein
LGSNVAQPGKVLAFRGWMRKAVMSLRLWLSGQLVASSRRPLGRADRGSCNLYFCGVGTRRRQESWLYFILLYRCFWKYEQSLITLNLLHSWFEIGNVVAIRGHEMHLRVSTRRDLRLLLISEFTKSLNISHLCRFYLNSSTRLSTQGILQ